MPAHLLRKIFILTLFALFACGSAIAQTEIPQAEIAADTTVIDSTTSDSLKTLNAPEKSGLEGPVKYDAERISFSIKKRQSYLNGNVTIKYQNIELEAGHVIINWDKSIMTAIGRVDSTDSLGNVLHRSPAVFKETGNEPIYGEELAYNFKTKRGRVMSGKTEMSPGYYKGSQINKIGKNTLLVRDGYFTTCDSIDHPHYYFRTAKMRIRLKKRAVAKPIIFYIADIPLMAVPFGVFPMEKGRRSGLLIPTFEKSNYGGNSLQNLGFYWAISDYLDATLMTDFYEKTGATFQGELRYRKRYKYSGNIKTTYLPKDLTTGEKKQNYSVDFSHSQTINQTTSFNAGGSYQSDRNLKKRYSHQLAERLDQTISMRASLSKRWPGAKNSLNVNLNRTENLQNGSIDYTFPNVRFSHTQTNLIPMKSKSAANKKWYHDIYYTYGSDFKNTGSKRFNESDTTFTRTEKLGMQHSASLNFNRKIFKYFKYNQSANFQELWTPDYLQYTWVDSLQDAVQDTIKEFHHRTTFSTSIGASTTIYGLFEIPFSPLKVIRHKMDPSISFSFSPDFTDDRWGYVQTFHDSLGRERKFDRFQNSAYGGTSSGESRSMNIRLGNLFQGKIIRDGEEKKIDLFNLNLSSSYNFLKDSLNWSDVSSQLRADAYKNLNLTVSARHSLYKAGSSGRGNRNEFVWNDGFALPRLLNVSFSTRIHLAPPKKKEKKDDEEKLEEDELAADVDEAVDDDIYIDDSQTGDITRDKTKDNLKKFSLPWDLSASFTYSLDRSNINKEVKRFSTQVSGRIELTPNWRVQYSANIDLLNRKITNQSFNIYRDLHCWEMSFAWSPSKAYSYFRLEIRVKDSMLKDLKVTKSSSGLRRF